MSNSITERYERLKAKLAGPHPAPTVVAWTHNPEPINGPPVGTRVRLDEGYYTVNPRHSKVPDGVIEGYYFGRRTGKLYAIVRWHECSCVSDYEPFWLREVEAPAHA